MSLDDRSITEPHNEDLDAHSDCDGLIAVEAMRSKTLIQKPATGDQAVWLQQQQRKFSFRGAGIPFVSSPGLPEHFIAGRYGCLASDIDRLISSLRANSVRPLTASALPSASPSLPALRR